MWHITLRYAVFLYVVLFRTNLSVAIETGSGDLQNSTHANIRSPVPEIDEENCRIDYDFVPKNCCSWAIKDFAKRWFAGGKYLTSYLTMLQKWDCPEFEKECSDPTYDFSEFTRLVYDRFCDQNKLRAKCTNEVAQVMSSCHGVAGLLINGTDLSEENWHRVADLLHPGELLPEDLSRPCVQVALFDGKTGGVGRFHEVVQPFIPFCPMVWSGYDIDTAMEGNVSPWTSMHTRCRANLIIAFVVIACLAAAIILANSVVISVFLSSKKLRNSQGVFKLSIAFGDLLVGLVVLPSVIYFHYLMFLRPQKMGDVIATRDVTNETALAVREPGGKFRSIVSNEHLDVVGFFTTISLVVSIYTLLFASFDRFCAIFRPLQYSKDKAKRWAAYSSIAVWVFGFWVALLPVITSEMEYSLVAAIFVSSAGESTLILLAVALGVPLIFLWVATIATVRAAHRHAHNRKKLRITIVGDNTTKNDKLERRLSRVLAVMVGIFSICIIPALLALVIAMFLDNVLFPLPKQLDPHAAMVYNSFEYSVFLLLLTNSLWNCIIYNARAADFRAAAKKTPILLAASAVAMALRNGGAFVLASARRLSHSENLRRLSGSSGCRCEEGRRGKRSSSSGTVNTKIPSFTDEHASVFSKDDSDSACRNVVLGDSVVHFSKQERPKSNKRCQETDTSFASFAIDAGTDRFFLSVMDNIKEEE